MRSPNKNKRNMKELTLLPKLVNADVTYISETHEYFSRDFRKLRGITGFINDQLFPGKLDNIPDNILRSATERGKAVHDEIERIDKEGIEPETVYGENYLDLKAESGLIHIASEYILTDNEFIASPTDKVYLGSSDKSVVLGDIKTTYKLDLLYLSWQLSIYAYLFERQNPNLKVEGLIAIWLRGDKDKDGIFSVERIPDSEIELFLNCCKNGVRYADNASKDSYIAKLESLPAKVAHIEEGVYELLEMQKKIDEHLGKFKEQLLGLMSESKADNIKGELISVTRKKAYSRESLDSKALKEQFPEIYDQFVKTSNVKESIQLKAL